jgi:hypothetical protein
MDYAGTLQSYSSTGGAREDILDLITEISPLETPFLSRIGVSVAHNYAHSWLTDVMNASAGGSASGDCLIEGASAIVFALQDKTRYTNYTQISDRTFSISGTEEAMWHYGLDSQYAYQLEKAMKELKMKMERILLTNGTGNSGGAASARLLRGAMHYALSASCPTASGAASVSALTETVYNKLCQDIFTAGGNPDTTFVHGFNKRRISAFASNNSRFTDMKGSKSLTGVISSYESDFGTQEIILDRYMTGLVGGLGGSASDLGAGLVCNMSQYRIAYLRKPFTTPLAIDGDRKATQILTEYTIECMSPTQQGILSAFATA